MTDTSQLMPDAVDGWGIPHECKNWNTITSYMDEHHFTHSLVTDIAPLFGDTGGH
jgi:hypothetical protein